MYQIGDKVTTWWQGKDANGTIIEIVRAHCYRVQLWSGEIVHRHEDDLERRAGT